MISVKTVTTKYILKNGETLNPPVVFRRNCWTKEDIVEDGGDRTEPPVDEMPFEENERRLLDDEETMRVDEEN